MMAIYQTGVLYQLIHALGLLALGVSRFEGKIARASGCLFGAGIVLFSGSLYALALTGVKLLGAVTPLGGVCFLGGWAALFVAANRDRP